MKCFIIITLVFCSSLLWSAEAPKEIRDQVLFSSGKAIPDDYDWTTIDGVGIAEIAIPDSIERSKVRNECIWEKKNTYRATFDVVDRLTIKLRSISVEIPGASFGGVVIGAQMDDAVAVLMKRGMKGTWDAANSAFEVSGDSLAKHGLNSVRIKATEAHGRIISMAFCPTGNGNPRAFTIVDAVKHRDPNAVLVASLAHLGNKIQIDKQAIIIDGGDVFRLKLEWMEVQKRWEVALVVKQTKDFPIDFCHGVSLLKLAQMQKEAAPLVGIEAAMERNPAIRDAILAECVGYDMLNVKITDRWWARIKDSGYAELQCRNWTGQPDDDLITAGLIAKREKEKADQKQRKADEDKWAAMLLGRDNEFYSIAVKLGYAPVARVAIQSAQKGVPVSMLEVDLLPVIQSIKPRLPNAMTLPVKEDEFNLFTPKLEQLAAEGNLVARVWLEADNRAAMEKWQNAFQRALSDRQAAEETYEKDKEKYNLFLRNYMTWLQSYKQ